MLLMVKGKMFHIKNFIFLISAFALLIFMDRYTFDDHGINQRIKETHQRFNKFDPELKGMVIGGSNAMWGLSAELLYKETGKKFYNFAMPSNGYNYLNYFDFLSSTLTSDQKSNIEYIIWSTIHPLDDPPYDDFSRTITGQLNSAFQGLHLSLAQRIKSGTLASSYKFLHDQENGDFLKESYNCTLSDPRILDEAKIRHVMGLLPPRLRLNKEFKFEHEVYSNFLAANFPNAKIFLVLPPTYYPAEVDSQVLEAMNQMTRDHGQSLFISSPLNKLSYLCDEWHHPSPMGRSIRTKNLAKIVFSYIN